MAGSSAVAAATIRARPAQARAAAATRASRHEKRGRSRNAARSAGGTMTAAALPGLRHSSTTTASGDPVRKAPCRLAGWRLSGCAAGAGTTPRPCTVRARDASIPLQQFAAADAFQDEHALAARLREHGRSAAGPRSRRVPPAPHRPAMPEHCQRACRRAADRRNLRRDADQAAGAQPLRRHWRSCRSPSPSGVSATVARCGSASGTVSISSAGNAMQRAPAASASAMNGPACAAGRVTTS